MELKKIRELMNAMRRSKISKLSLKDGDFELSLESESSDLSREDLNSAFLQSHLATPLPVNVRPSHLAMASHEQVLGATASAEKEAKVAEVHEAPSDFITSPIVGTFYQSPSPDTSAFVKIGDQVEADTVVCIVEAMKVMNEVKAGIAGTVAEAMVKDGDPVEFGSQIFRLET